MTEPLRQGDDIEYKGIRGWVVYTFAVPSSDGPGFTVRLSNMRGNVIVNPADLKLIRF